jgi:hypothetical protein
MGVKPADVKESWDDNDVWSQAQLIAYNQIREYEEDEDRINLYKASGAKLK